MAGKKKSKRKTSSKNRAPVKMSARPSPRAPSEPYGRRAVHVGVLGGALLLMFLVVAILLTPAEKVQVDYLFSNSCGYCAQATLNTQAAVAQMDGRVTLNYLDGGLRAGNATLAARYTYYKDTGLFGGFPTLVAHGPKGERSLVGLRPQNEVHAWLCQQFTRAPSSCS